MRNMRIGHPGYVAGMSSDKRPAMLARAINAISALSDDVLTAEVLRLESIAGVSPPATLSALCEQDDGAPGGVREGAPAERQADELVPQVSGE